MRFYLRRVLRYERYQRAALTIQWAYRSYRVLQLSRKRLANFSGLDYLENKHLISGASPAAVETKERWKRLLSGEATFQEKTDLWRNIVELRRAYGYSTDLCLKALLHANGDLTRALSMIGNQEFSFRYGSDKLPTEVYAMFLPTIASTIKKQEFQAGSGHIGGVNSASKFRLSVQMNKRSRRQEIKAHKKLHEHLYAAAHQATSGHGHHGHGSQGGEEDEDEGDGMVDLTHIMWKNYLVRDKRNQYSNM